MYHLIPSPISPSLTAPPLWQPPVYPLYLRVCFCFFCLFIYPRKWNQMVFVFFRMYQVLWPSCALSLLHVLLVTSESAHSASRSAVLDHYLWKGETCDYLFQNGHSWEPMSFLIIWITWNICTMFYVHAFSFLSGSTMLILEVDSRVTTSRALFLWLPKQL